MKQHQEKRSSTGKRNDASQLSRRNFLKMGVGTLIALALLEVGGASLLFMQPRSLEGEFGGLVKAGPVDTSHMQSRDSFTPEQLTFT